MAINFDKKSEELLNKIKNSENEIEQVKYIRHFLTNIYQIGYSESEIKHRRYQDGWRKQS